MLTHRQQSFIATLCFGTSPVNTLDTLLGKPAWVNWLGIPVTVPHMVGTIRNDSSMLSCQPGVTDKAIALYFRHTPEGYRLYVREPGEHFGKTVVMHDDVYLGLLPSSARAASTFTLLKPNGEPASYADLITDTNLAGLAYNGKVVGPSRRHNSPFEYMAAKEGNNHLWVLRLLERNVPWVSSPDEL